MLARCHILATARAPRITACIVLAEWALSRHLAGPPFHADGHGTKHIVHPCLRARPRPVLNSHPPHWIFRLRRPAQRQY